VASEHRIRRSLAGFIGIALLASIVIGVIGGNFEARRHGTEVPPKQIYEALFSRPLPDEVRDLQATGTTWQGYSIYLRFRTPSIRVAGITIPPYEYLECADILPYLNLPAEIGSTFSPEWSVPLTESGSCLGAYELSNAWTKLGSHYLMKSGEWVYFAGFGS
jgi:hypothetical protein